MAREQSSVGELLPLLESTDLRQLEVVKGVIRDHLCTDRGSVFLYTLVDYYLETGSPQAMQMLCSVSEPHDKHLLDKMNECIINKASRLPTLMLLGHVVRKQPSWIHKIARVPLLVSLLKCLKTDSNVVVLITGVLVLITLLPMIPQPGKQHLYEFFDIFGRLAAWNLRNPAGHVTEVHLIHLYASVYSLFHRLYGMYPCNFVSYLRSHYSMKENVGTFEEVVKPMLEHVRIHPELVTGTKDHELDPTRWKKFEVHDIVIECAKVSLDPKEASCEEGYSTMPEHFSAHHQLRPLDCTTSSYTDITGSCGSCSSTPLSTPRQGLPVLSGSQPPHQSPQTTRHQMCELNSCGLKDPLWSPSSICGMSTPPSSRGMSPTNAHECSHNNLPGRVLATLASGKGTPSFSTPVTSSPPMVLMDEAANTTWHPNRSSPSRKDSRLESQPSKPSLTRQDPVRELERSSVETLCIQDGSSENVSMTLKEVSDFFKEQEYEQRIEKEQEEDAIAKELLKITEDTPELWELHSPFCHTTETLTGNQELAATTALNPGEKPRHAASTPSKPEGFLMGSDRGTGDQPWSFQAVFTPIDGPAPDGEGDGEGAGPMPCSFFSPRADACQTQPYEALFELALPRAAMLFIARKTLEQQEEEAVKGVRQVEGTHAADHPSPLEVLDQLIQQGHDAHDKVLKRLPLPSKSADWTHFGGSAPQDELHTLRSQLLLLHNQLLYERYKREMHAVRNRRLLRRIINATALEEQNNAMKDQLNLQNMDTISLRKSLHVEQRRYQQLWEDRETVVTRLQGQIRQLQQSRDKYYTKNQEKQSKLHECQKKMDELEAELQKANNKVCNMGHQLKQLSVKLTGSESIQQQVAFLNQQLLLLGQANKLCTEELQRSTPDASRELQMVQGSWEKEQEKTRQSLVSKGQQLEAAQQRVAELEAQLTKKEHLVLEQKKFLEDVKSQAKAELQASESRYLAQRKVTHVLQAELLQLYSRLEMEGHSSRVTPTPLGATTQAAGSIDYRPISSDSLGRCGPSQQDNESTLSSVNGSQEAPHPHAPPPALGSYLSEKSFLGKHAWELSRGTAEDLKTALCVDPLVGAAPIRAPPHPTSRRIMDYNEMHHDQS